MKKLLTIPVLLFALVSCQTITRHDGHVYHQRQIDSLNVLIEKEQRYSADFAKITSGLIKSAQEQSKQGRPEIALLLCSVATEYNNLAKSHNDEARRLNDEVGIAY